MKDKVSKTFFSEVNFVKKNEMIKSKYDIYRNYYYQHENPKIRKINNVMGSLLRNLDHIVVSIPFEFNPIEFENFPSYYIDTSRRLYNFFPEET